MNTEHERHPHHRSHKKVLKPWNMTIFPIEFASRVQSVERSTICETEEFYHPVSEALTPLLSRRGA
jgi:hypothetical protein